jgi:hypothetical protein
MNVNICRIISDKMLVLSSTGVDGFVSDCTKEDDEGRSHVENLGIDEIMYQWFTMG